MKKKLYLFAAVALAMASCSEEDIASQNSGNQLRKMEITAGMAEGDSRTSFTDGGIKWQANDALSVFVGGTTNYKFDITEGIGENEATFQGEATIGSYPNNVAYYPYAEGVSMTSTDNGAYQISATFPTQQNWAADGSFGPNSLPMVAVNARSESEFAFKPLGGWLQLYVKGNTTITKVVMKAKGHQIAGAYTVTAAEDKFPTMKMVENAVDYVALYCGEGVQLKNDAATLFTFAVAPFTFAAGEVSFDLYDDKGTIMPDAYIVEKAGTIIANAYYTLSKSAPVEYQGVPLVATIGEIGYASLQAAIENVEDGETITLVNDVTTETTLTVSEEKNIIIDLNGKVINGTMHKNNGHVITNNGNLKLIGGTVKSTANNGGSAFKNNGTMIVEGTTLNGAPNADGSWPSYTINNTGELTLTDANITSYHGALASYGANAVATLNNTNIDMQGIKGFTSHAIYTYENGKVVVNGGEIANKATDQAASGASVINGYVEVNDGVFSGRIENYYGNPVLKGGTFSVNPTKFVAEGYKVISEGENWKILDKSWIAKINEVPYTSLKAAIEAVQDGETITLVDNEKFTEDNRTHNSSTWYDGIYYVGDKNFTIDLNGKTISQDGSVNDYMLNFKNDGEKANTIILKNGTVDAGTTAFCALCTSSGSTQELTINLEDINLINNISNGSTVKLRGGAVLNVKEGTVITGKNSYLGIESVASTVNIYDGAEIYMNGTSSYNGCLVGACGNGIVNVYGGKGKGVKGGFIAMTSGGTINIEGGEWTANNDGTIGNNSNLYVLTSQNNNKESGYVGASIINVSGGTFRGGMDAWILNPGTTPKENAELNISGGCFNANPSSYLAEGFVTEKNETTGLWTVVELGYTKAENGDITVKSLVGLKNALTMAGAAGAGDTNITLSGDMDMTGVEWTPINVDGYHGADIVTLDGNNATIKGLTAPLFAGGFAGGSGIVIKNLTIDASTIVSTNTMGSGAFVESSDSQSKVELVNCHLKNSSVTGSRTGGLVGWTSGYNNVNDGPVKSYITLENCSVTNCTITGSSVGGLNGHAGANAWTYTTIKDCTVTGCTLNSTDDGDWRVGVAVGTANVGEVTITNLTENGNTLTQTGKTAPTGEKRNYFGRFVPGTTGKLVIDGEIIDLSVAKVGNNKYLTIDEAIANWGANTTLTLLKDVTLSDVVTLKSTEHHILDLGTYTMTAASGKNAFVIKACGTGDAERTAITIKADAANPGGINAGSKCIIYYKYADGGISGNDRPIIKIEGGVFTGSTSSWGTAGIYTIGKEARKCATLNISGGTFNCSINGTTKSKLLITGGVFHYSVGSQGDSTALRLISGGKFKTLGFMTADSNNTKFWFGTSMGVSNVGMYIDDDNYLVVGGPVITEFGDMFKAKATNPTKWNSLLQYSSAANGLYYTNAEMAIKKHGADNVVKP